MTRRAIFPIGLVSITTAWLALGGIATAQTTGIYQMIRADIEAEFASFDVSNEVLEFAVAVVNTDGGALSAEQAKNALTLPPAVVCRGEDANSSADPGDPNTTENIDDDRTECIDRINRLLRLLRRESQVQKVGRDVQAIVGSAELATDSYPGMGTESLLFSEATRMIWGTNQSGSEATLSVRAWPKDNDTIEEDLKKVRSELAKLKPEEQTGAIWRALYGTLYAKGERGGLNIADTPEDPDNAPGTERQYLWKEQPDLDEALLKLREDLLALTPSSSSSSSSSDEAEESKIITLYPPKSLGNNVVVWVSTDDVGLRQEVPIHPVLPSLMGGKVIEGGTWPPAPPGPEVAPLRASDEDDSRGLCLDTIAADGFLCHVPKTAESPCEEEAEPEDGSIVLAACEGSEEETKETPAGPLICEDLVWRKGGFDEDYQCTYEIGCSDVCNDASGSPNAETEFHVFRKQDKEGEEALSRACVKRDSRLISGYQVLQAASGLRLTCELPNDFEPYLSLPEEEKPLNCCDQIGQMAAVMCRAMEEDGVFTEGDGSRAVSTEGDPFSAGNCVLAFAADYCGPECGGPTDENYLTELIDRANENPADVPESCDEALEQDRVQKMLTEVEDIDEACSPDRVVEMDNTILSNACYAGRCLEYTLKMRNTTPGNGALTAIDVAQPFMSFLGEREQLPEVIELAPIPQNRLPRYLPAQVVGNFDQAYCQLNGLPPLMPQTLCAVDPLRRLILPLIEPFAQQSNLDQQRAELAAAQRSFLRVGLPAGVRIGDDLFLEMMRASVQALTDSLKTSAELLDSLRDVDFTNELCPLSPTQGLTGSSASASSDAFSS